MHVNNRSVGQNTCALFARSMAVRIFWEAMSKSAGSTCMWQDDFSVPDEKHVRLEGQNSRAAAGKLKIFILKCLHVAQLCLGSLSGQVPFLFSDGGMTVAFFSIASPSDFMHHAQCIITHLYAPIPYMHFCISRTRPPCQGFPFLSMLLWQACPHAKFEDVKAKSDDLEIFHTCTHTHIYIICI